MERNKWTNSNEVIQTGKDLVEKELSGSFNMKDVSDFALEVLNFMSEEKVVNRQLHHALPKHLSKKTITASAFTIFFNFAKRCSASNIDFEFELIAFRDAGLIGDNNLQVTESVFKNFYERAKSIVLPDR